MSHGKSLKACDAVLLTQSLKVVKSDSTLSLSWLKLIDKENYSEVKKKAGASIPEYFDGNYEDFDNKRSKEFSKEQFNLTSEQARLHVHQIRGNDKAKEAWLACMLKGEGLKIAIEAVSDKMDEVIVVLKWSPYPGMQELRDIKVNTNSQLDTGGLLELNELQKGVYRFIAKRDKENNYLISISGVAGETDEVFSDKIEIPQFVESRPPLRKEIISFEVDSNPNDKISEAKYYSHAEVIDLSNWEKDGILGLEFSTGGGKKLPDYLQGNFKYHVEDITSKFPEHERIRKLVFSASYGLNGHHESKVFLKRGHIYEVTGRIMCQVRTEDIRLTSQVTQRNNNYYLKNQLDNANFEVIKS